MFEQGPFIEIPRIHTEAELGSKITDIQCHYRLIDAYLGGTDRPRAHRASLNSMNRSRASDKIDTGVSNDGCANRCLQLHRTNSINRGNDSHMLISLE